MDRTEVEKEITDFLENIFKEVSIAAVLEFPEEKNANDLYYIDITTGDSNIIIGYHGETLNSLQHILNLFLFKKFDEKIHVLLDVAGYREERDDKLKELAKSASEKARFLDKSVALYAMNSYERKIVHEAVSEIENVTSESEGEGANRRVVISPESVGDSESSDDGENNEEE